MHRFRCPFERRPEFRNATIRAEWRARAHECNDEPYGRQGLMEPTVMWRCLVVEDDADNARYIANGFRALGHVVVICRDGMEALGRATSEQWDLIILDRMLPNEVDGLFILSTLRGLGKKTPVLVLSALSALDERVRGLKAGGDDYLTKPFAFSELAARAEALVRRSRPGPPIPSRFICFQTLSAP